MQEEVAEQEATVADWLLATPSDVANVDFEEPIRGLVKADCGALVEQFKAAVELDEKTGRPTETAANRVFCMLIAVAGMMFQPRSGEPFGPMLVLPDGRRSPVPDDFLGKPLETLTCLAECTRNPVLRARLADVCWTLDRKLVVLGAVAVASYVEVVEKIDAGELQLPFEKNGSALDHECRDFLRRALQIGRQIGWDRPEVVSARDLTKDLRVRALGQHAAIAIGWFSGLDLEFRVSGAEEVASSLDASIKDLAAGLDASVSVNLLNLAARAYRSGKNNEQADRCLSEAADCLAAQAERDFEKTGSALLAANGLSAAIAQLHGVRGKRDRRKELRHRLVDLQALISEQLSMFSYQTDIRDLVERVERQIERMSLLEKLFAFTSSIESPDPDHLRRVAETAIKKFPPSSLFEASHLDREGKTTHRSSGIRGVESTISAQIARDESVRRISAAATIDVVRQAIHERHYLSGAWIFCLLNHSPFVPRDLVATFSRGALSFFRGDFVSATYILTPLLESSLRHVLKTFGHDVSKFDDASQTQQDLTISLLFQQMRLEMESIFTTATVADLERVFLTAPGPRLRHAVAHGLLHDGQPFSADAVYGCAMIIRLCLLPLVVHKEHLEVVLKRADGIR